MYFRKCANVSVKISEGCKMTQGTGIFPVILLATQPTRQLPNNGLRQNLVISEHFAATFVSTKPDIFRQNVGCVRVERNGFIKPEHDLTLTKWFVGLNLTKR